MPQRLETILHPSKTTLDILAWKPSQAEMDREERWVKKQIIKIGIPWLENLAFDAAQARKLAYAPNSHYHVGAAMLDKAGKTHKGQNIEIVTLSETGHAEEQSVKDPIKEGIVEKLGREFVEALAVSHEGDTSPCGRCRQIMYQFADNALVVIADPEGNVRRITSLRILLPDAFGPKDLGIE